MNPTLPTKLSALIELAISDAHKLDREIYYPSFAMWHSSHDSYENGASCAICLAGAVIAGSLRQPHEVTVSLGSYPIQTCNSLFALNAVRAGDIEAAFEEMGTKLTSLQREEVEKLESKYTENSDFRGWGEFNLLLNEMADLATELKAIGL